MSHIRNLAKVAAAAAALIVTATASYAASSPIGVWYDETGRGERKFDVELTLKGDKLVVLGYAGMKMFGVMVVWKRAPANLPRCRA